MYGQTYIHIPRQPSTVALLTWPYLRFSRLAAAILLFFLFATILAPQARLFCAVRLSQLASHVRPSTTAAGAAVTTARTSSISAATARPLMTASMAPSSRRSPPQAPPLFTATPASVMADTKRLLARSKAVQDAAAAVPESDATFDNILLPQARDDDEFGLEANVLSFYRSVSTDAKLRDASTEAGQMMDEFVIEAGMREDIFVRTRKVYEDVIQNKRDGLDPESTRLLEKEYLGFIRNGLGLPPGEKRDRYKAIRMRLSELSTQFAKNLNEENGGLWFTREELAGVPDDVLAGLRVGTEADGADSMGKLRLTFKYPDIFPVWKYCVNADTRQKVMIANENKCNANVPLFKETIVLRDEAARLLGYPNHAAFRIEDKMAKNPERVNEFLGDLRARLQPGGVAEIAALKKLKAIDIEARGGKFDGHYYLWDHRFYDRLMLERDYSLDHQLISEYFPLSTTIRGMLGIFEQLFGLEFIDIPAGPERDHVASTSKGADVVWHEDVQLFSVWDDEGEGGGFVGYLYLDLFPREGKYGHAANFNLQPVSVHN